MSDLLFVVLGLGVGVAIGLTGVGGGSFLTPFLIIVLRFHPAVAVASSLVFTLVTRAVGSIQHMRQRTVDYNVVRQLAVGSVPVAVAASLVLARLVGKGAASDPIRAELVQLCLLVAACVLTYRLLVPARPGRGTDNPVSLTLLGALVGGDMVHALILAAVAAPLALLQTNIDFQAVALLLVGSLPGVFIGSRLAVLIPERFTRLTVTVAVWALALKVG